MAKGLRYQINFKSVIMSQETIRTYKICIDREDKKNHLEASSTKQLDQNDINPRILNEGSTVFMFKLTKPFFK